MAVIGDFCGWVEPGIPMAKNADGKWEVAVKSTMDGVLKYKFWYKGTYIYDFKSPDKIDDGFGGNNGLIEVSKVLAKQKAAELAASGDAAGAAALMAQAGASDSGLKFLTWSMLGFQTKFTVGEEMAAESAGINLKSYWKMTGNAVPNMPVFFEVAVAEQDAKKALSAVHTLKGVSANLGLTKLFEICSTMVIKFRAEDFENAFACFDEVKKQYDEIICIINKGE